MYLVIYGGGGDFLGLFEVKRETQCRWYLTSAKPLHSLPHDGDRWFTWRGITGNAGKPYISKGSGQIVMQLEARDTWDKQFECLTTRLKLASDRITDADMILRGARDLHRSECSEIKGSRTLVLKGLLA